MSIKVRLVWLDEDGCEIPETDKRLYATNCGHCGCVPSCGVARYQGEFLCLGCLDDRLNSDEFGD